MSLKLTVRFRSLCYLLIYQMVAGCSRHPTTVPVEQHPPPLIDISLRWVLLKNSIDVHYKEVSMYSFSQVRLQLRLYMEAHSYRNHMVVIITH